MKKKHAFTTAIVVLILAVLVYLQFHSWKNFDWTTFRSLTASVNGWKIASAVGLIYSAYIFRAIRWAIFLRPARKISFHKLIGLQIIGFTGLALLGRPGEFVRPYLIARKVNLSFASQLAVWTVERVFDMASVALLLGVGLGFRGGKFKQYPQVQHVGFAMLALAAFVSLVIFLIWWQSETISKVAESFIRPFSRKLAEAICRKVRAFGKGLNTLENFRAFLTVAAVSVVMWLLIGSAYIQVTHAYDGVVNTPGSVRTVRMDQMHLEDVMIVMGSSMAGSVVQLPGGVGGSQLAVIKVLSSEIFHNEPYNITRELAVSCGIMLWLVTFMSVIPAGLLMAKFERVSFRAVESESEAAEEEVEQLEHS